MATMSKVQVLDENKRLRDQCEVLERKVHELGMQLAAIHRYETEEPTPSDTEAMRSEPRAQALKVPHASYYDYVRAVKHVAKARGLRVATYKTRQQWETAVAAHFAGRA